MLGFSHF